LIVTVWGGAVAVRKPTVLQSVSNQTSWVKAIVWSAVTPGSGTVSVGSAEQAGRPGTGSAPVLSKR
jgi:hypothetical protein